MIYDHALLFMDRRILTSSEEISCTGREDNTTHKGMDVFVTESVNAGKRRFEHAPAVMKEIDACLKSRIKARSRLKT